MLFGILFRCDSSSEIVAGLQAFAGKLNHLGLESSPEKSTFGDGLRDRDNKFSKVLYFQLLDHFKPVLSDSQSEEVFFKQLFIFDSTTIILVKAMASFEKTVS